MAPVTSGAVPLVELWRGGLLESVHAGHAVIWGPGGIEAAWGNPDAVIFPRSSCKMLQALPLMESGAADAAGLSERQLALACASHRGEPIHTMAVADWLDDLGLREQDLRCGAHYPFDRHATNDMIRADHKPCQLHNNCSGKHAGFLTLNRHLGAGSEYIEIDHPVQVAIKAAFEEVVEETSPGYGIDGCSAPNFACTLGGLARAMAFFAAAREGAGTRPDAAARLTRAMIAFPEMIAGTRGSCTLMMQAAEGRAAIKTGAEAVYVAILPDQKRGVALKVLDGGTRASEAAIAALMVRLGAIEKGHPVMKRFLGPFHNWRGMEVGETRLAPGFA